MLNSEQILFGPYFNGSDKPLKNLPRSRIKPESQTAFVTRRRIIADIQFLDQLFGPVRPSSFR